jgi:plasmid stabilization system protein ParE
MSAPASDLCPGTRKLVIRNLPYVAFIRQLDSDVWEVVDVVHTARKLPVTE